METLKNLFGSKGSRVVRTLLCNPGKTWTIRELAAEAQVGNHLVQKTIGTLFRDNLATRRKEDDRIVLVDPLRLLKRWAGQTQFPGAGEIIEYFSLQSDIDRLLLDFRVVGLKYALTLHAGALFVSPEVRPNTIVCYAPDKQTARGLASSLKLQPVEVSGNVRFVIPEDAGVFYGVRILDSVRVVSNVQLYVDLLNYPARGEEAAAPILKIVRDEWAGVLLGGK